MHHFVFIGDEILGGGRWIGICFLKFPFKEHLHCAIPLARIKVCVSVQ